MENASKALLIAGAVLLVIALIAVGMGIFGTARGVTDNAEGQIDNIAIQMHNKQFEQYEGVGVYYDKVKEMVSLIVSNNQKVGDKAFRVNFGYGYYNSAAANGTFNTANIQEVTIRDYKYNDDNIQDDLTNYQTWILNKNIYIININVYHDMMLS